MTDHLTENARLRAALLTCINMLDDLVAESGRGVEYGEEDAFRMGEWFDDHDLMNIEAARAALATPAPDAVQEAARVPEIAALIDAVAPYADPLCIGDYDTLMTAYRRLMIAITGDRT